ncbi:MAG: DUF4287 domain-containing protein [Anaerolineaceae bacterium]|nr:DUF4287 domain-containing protein [Anaerolineaceae bacterium]
MDSLSKARDTQLKNIEIKTGKGIDELRSVIKQSGLTKHGEIRSMLIEKFGLGYGDANSLVHFALETDGQTAAEASNSSLEELVNEIYSGPKANFRALHDHLMALIHSFGEFEIAPKKGYLSLRRKRQFIMIGPASNTRFELGLNIKDLEENPRIKPQPKGSMCDVKVVVNSIEEVDQPLIDWMKRAYVSAG